MKALRSDSSDTPPVGAQRILLNLSLRTQIALGVALPLLITLAVLSISHYHRMRSLSEEQIRTTAEQLGEVALGSLRHAMLTNDRQMLARSLSDIDQQDNIYQIQIINMSGQGFGSSEGELTKRFGASAESDCEICHQYPPDQRPRTAFLEKTSSVLRVSAPIPNEEACRECHMADSPHLGVLLIDASMSDISRHLTSNLRADLAISVTAVVLVTAGTYILIHLLIIRRVNSFGDPLAEFASGDFSARLPRSPNLGDEFDRLAYTFNRMADDLSNHIQKENMQRETRQKSIIEERERIARELHDGLAQLLGYVNTKVLAVRLHLKKEELEAADLQLSQLEEASRELYKETREAIYDLRMAGDATNGLIETLENYTRRFSNISNLSVKLEIDPEMADVWLSMEKELHLLRIIQEALTNCRKHAFAKTAWVRLGLENGSLKLVIQDNGKGFSPSQADTENGAYFGLSIMRERSEEIGAEFELKTEPGAGTQVSVRLPLSE